jgi:putative hydrolase of HD superfamily
LTWRYQSAKYKKEVQILKKGGCVKSKKDNVRIADFLFEIGTMRKLMRMHRQVLLTDDMSDSIASHSFRVGIIGWFLAKMEKIDPFKVAMMGFIHDMTEIRSNDHNWLHHRYVTVHEDEISREQLGQLPFPDLHLLIQEYEERKTREAITAKDADELDQILLLREYEWQGNKEASLWLNGKRKRKKYARLERLKTKSAMELGKIIYNRGPSEWWKFLWTAKRRTT